ncbi:MAG: DMT family transporter [Burkholderiaceae bacterium]|jgi:drug/metabolite transporter (DMT)-like permease|nr:DMT family transporter [Burkholderiaceae bacterium]
MIAPDPTALHRRAIVLMVIAPTLWSIAGVVTRHLSPELQAHGRFEITFWRSLFAAVFVGGYLLLVRRDLAGSLRRAGVPGLASGAMWATMFICFMLALTLTSTANTLIVLAVAPLVTALLAWAALRAPIAPRTWLAIAIAMAGIIWMFAGSLRIESPASVLGMLIAFGAPLASAVNVVILKKRGHAVDLVPAVFLGGVISAGLMLPLALPSIATNADIALLALLGFAQLGLPCMLLVIAARHLAATEVALLALLEVVLGPLWAWLGAGEVPPATTLSGGALVLAALLINELAGRAAQPA